MVLRMIVGLGLTVIAFAVAGRRLWWLRRLAFSGQPAPERLEDFFGFLRERIAGARKYAAAGRDSR